MKKDYVDTIAQFGGVAYGNKSYLRSRFATNASGIMVDSDLATAVVDTTVVKLLKLPAGMELIDFQMKISDAFTAATTAKFGFEYCDGVDVTAVPEDDDYFMAATTTAALGLSRMVLGSAPVVLPKDAYLIMTVGGADHASVGVMDVVVEGILRGPK
jgi:hypothetical protein